MSQDHAANSRETDSSSSGERPLSREEFSSEFKRVFRTLWLVAAASVGNRSLADDVIQEAAIVAWKRIGRFRRGTNFAGWMVRIVQLEAKNVRRSDERHHAGRLIPPPRSLSFTGPRDELGFAQDTPCDPDQMLNCNLFDDDVTAALCSLSDTSRACLLLRVVGGEDYASIARLLDMPKGTAMSHVHRARMQMQQRLNDTFATRERKYGRLEVESDER